MTIDELNQVHSEIMDLIIKSDSAAATVTFRRFDDGEFMVSFWDNDFYNPGKIDTVYLNSDISAGEALVDRVRAFLFVNAKPTEYRNTHAQNFPSFRPVTPDNDDEYYG